MKRERLKSIIAMIFIALMFVLMSYVEGMPAEDNKSDSRVIIVPNSDAKQIIVMEDKTSTTIVDLTNNKILFCTTDDGSLVICQDLSTNK